ncbi:matrixin family metalloprotease [Roseovarius aestuarii]|uniref:Hemolysin, plasmid n=1 Tax=Roseovarius aestuarii TaxID=475083 RepID=A0A1X7BWQ7_9RHOB|nr:matrixin family metalloprotease [Roseovarius aestuarii]SMC14078.1 Hemolysin, plasmid [Roseovarius aestuarii]
MANLAGTKWGSNKIGTKGGVVTWSIAGAGENISGFGTASGNSVSGGSFLNFDFRQVISDAFASWSNYGDIEFIQVSDPGGGIGTSAASDIRIFFGVILGSFIGFASFPTQNASAIAGDIVLDTLGSFNTDMARFRGLVLHEIGHALGLDHAGVNSIMAPRIRLSSLQQDDINGIRQIYGAQDNADPVYKVKGGGTVRILEGLDNLTIKGNSKNNKIIGSSEDEVMTGSSGNDFLNGGGGADSLFGGTGRDKLAGGAGADVLNGGSARDTADYSSSNAAIAFDLAVSSTGTAGHALGDTLIKIEKIIGGAGDDTLSGSNGVDRFAGGDGSDLLSGLDGNDKLAGGNGADTLDGGNGNDNLIGGSGADLLRGMANGDTLRGDDGNDTLEGGSGNDILEGGDDQDVLNGGTGNDKLEGGRSADTFIFVDGHGNDRITDFKPSSTAEFIDFSGVTALSDFGDVLAASSDTAKGVLIDTGGGDSILLKGIGLNMLGIDDFLF